MLRLSDFDYHLPKELIAQRPLAARDEARLLVLDRKKGKAEHRAFKDILGYLDRDDLLVLNDTKVLPCRILGKRKTGGKIELLLLGHKGGLTFNALIKPARLKQGEKIYFEGGKASVEVLSRNEVIFSADNIEAVYGLGVMPLPPYIKREAEADDNIYYQTVYAKEEGAVASPTAGLHFTLELLEKILGLGIGIAYLTLHVGHGTFKPVKEEDITKHKMDPEYFKVPDQSIRMIEETKRKKKRVFAVGTTSLRALESCVDGKTHGYTDLFIYPGFKFKAADCLLTNFHLPRTTLFTLVCAFAGEGLAKKAYQEAVNNKYRFYSYGDAMLIL